MRAGRCGLPKKPGAALLCAQTRFFPRVRRSRGNAQKGLLRNAVYRPKQKIHPIKKLVRTADSAVLTNFFFGPIFQILFCNAPFGSAARVRDGFAPEGRSIPSYGKKLFCSLRGALQKAVQRKGRTKNRFSAAMPKAVFKAIPHNSSAALAMPLFAICCLQIFRLPSGKPSKSAIASDEKFNLPSHQRICAVLP